MQIKIQLLKRAGADAYTDLPSQLPHFLHIFMVTGTCCSALHYRGPSYEQSSKDKKTGRFTTNVDRYVDTAGDAGAVVRGGRHDDDNFTCLRHKNCCQVAEDKDEKKIKRAATAPSELKTQALQQLLSSYPETELSDDGGRRGAMCTVTWSSW